MLPAEYRILQASLKMKRFLSAPYSVMQAKLERLSGNAKGADRVFVLLEGSFCKKLCCKAVRNRFARGGAKTLTDS